MIVYKKENQKSTIQVSKNHVKMMNLQINERIPRHKNYHNRAHLSNATPSNQMIPIEPTSTGSTSNLPCNAFP